MVSSPSEPSFASRQDPVTDLVTESARECDLRSLLSDPCPSRLDFLSRVYRRLYSPQAVEYVLKSKRPSSLRQFESVWRSWLDFVRLRHPPAITEDLVLSFFVYLFEVDGYLR